ncbi:hypothetical protein BRC83_00490 [Halobacteriales archaeon QS_1_68_17]|nr:MAG: hypothetical protein BRC83_00490 [Halobacteriales archaeon QS_1_68_17]
MPKVDAKGRIVLPKEVRDRLGITPGTEVEVREEDGRAIVEPEDEPERIIERMEKLVSETASRRERTSWTRSVSTGTTGCPKRPFAAASPAHAPRTSTAGTGTTRG